MPLSLTAYRRASADPKRSEVARRAAWTRQMRQEALDIAIKRFSGEHERYPSQKEIVALRRRTREMVPPYRSGLK